MLYLVRTALWCLPSFFMLSSHLQLQPSILHTQLLSEIASEVQYNLSGEKVFINLRWRSSLKEKKKRWGTAGESLPLFLQRSKSNEGNFICRLKVPSIFNNTIYTPHADFWTTVFLFSPCFPYTLGLAAWIRRSYMEQQESHGEH